MAVTEQDLEQALNRYRSKFGGARENYFAPLHLVDEFHRTFDEIAGMATFNPNDSGIDAFYFDESKHDFYLYQCKWTHDYRVFKESLPRLSKDGLDRAFGPAGRADTQFITALRESLNANRDKIEHVVVRLLFNGDPASADNSAVLERFREELESRKHIIDRFFPDRAVTLIFQYLGNGERRREGIASITRTHKFEVHFEQQISAKGPRDASIYVGFVPLMDIYQIYREMGTPLFTTNVRSMVSRDSTTNRAIRQALSRIAIHKSDPPDVFLFNHNGVTLAAKYARIDNGKLTLVQPRVLNGVQTIASLAHFIEEHSDENISGNAHLQSVRVMAKIVCDCPDEFVLDMAVANNRQNPVESSGLRVNDRVQLELQDRFRDELSIVYDRAYEAPPSATAEDLDERGIEDFAGIDIVHLALTMLAAQGEIDRMHRLGDVFESEIAYRAAFRDVQKNSDLRRVVLAYKIQFQLNRIIRELIDRSEPKFNFVMHSRNLLWALLIQCLLNDEISLPGFLKQYGTHLREETGFHNILLDLAVKRVRMVIAEALSERRFQALPQDKHNLLRTKAFYQRCMDIACPKYNWRRETL